MRYLTSQYSKAMHWFLFYFIRIWRKPSMMTVNFVVKSKVWVVIGDFFTFVPVTQLDLVIKLDALECLESCVFLQLNLVWGENFTIYSLTHSNAKYISKFLPIHNYCPNILYILDFMFFIFSTSKQKIFYLIYLWFNTVLIGFLKVCFYNFFFKHMYLFLFIFL